LNLLCSSSCSCGDGIDDISPIVDIIAEDRDSCLSLSDGNEEEGLSSIGDGCDACDGCAGIGGSSVFLIMIFLYFFIIIII
jgi:hypothetical protein